MASWKYDTFLNSTHDSASNTFLSSLSYHLQKMGIKAFNDDRDVRSRTQVMEAIEESRTALVIFSWEYDLDTRCLEELSKIMECVEIKGLIPIPVFYGVYSDFQLRRLLDKMTVRLLPYVRFKGITVQNWMDSLHKAPQSLVFPNFRSPSYNRKKAKNGFKVISDKIWLAQSIAKYPVGIESRVNEIKSLLKLDFTGVYYVGVCGISGAGKTTVARAIFDDISCQFEGSCFLANVQEVSEEHGLRHLKQELLSQIVKQELVDVSSDDEAVYLKKVLIVLDDVDNAHQLEYLVGNRDWFGDGSRIITTTRNAELLCKHDELYRVPQLASHEALALFNWHAFQQAVPVEEFEELSNCVVDYAKGLPLVLEVVGYFLHKRGMCQLRSDLHRLKNFENGKIVQLLSLSLDELCNDDKNIFLQIACFFRGKTKDYVVTVLDRLGFKPDIGLDVLIERSFIYLSKGIIQMHDSIGQMGQQVARDAEQDKPRNYNSRLWHEKNITTLCSASQITGTPTFLVASENESTTQWKYDTFLSFRGEDTRNGFISHLFKCLQARGINAFKDVVKLQRGTFISPEILEAIEKSRTAIIIFSENYASSTWCLEELTKIMECVEKKRQKAIPVFYNIEPSDVRRHRNSFAHALAKHEEDLKDTDLEKVQRWKDALCKAAGICGWDVQRTANG